MASSKTPKSGYPDDDENDDSVERRLIQVSERLERASSDLQKLVDQLRSTFNTTNGLDEDGQVPPAPENKEDPDSDGPETDKGTDPKPPKSS